MTMWRYRSRLPVERGDELISLGEGGTPIVDLSATLGRALGVRSLVAKAEDRNPTGSFKARIAAVAYTLVRARALHGSVGTSSGNGGAAAAAYAAASGSRALLFTLTDTVPGKMAEILAVGGRAWRMAGVGHDARTTVAVAEAVAEAAERSGYYPMLTGFRFAPEAMCGVKTIAWELAEQASATTVVYAPVGGGGLLTGLHRGYAEFDAPLPRLVGAHPEGAGALPAALEGRLGGMDGPVRSVVSGLQMAVLYDAEGATEAVRNSGGHARAVSDAAILDAQQRLARDHGLMVEPAAATPVAALIADVEEGRIGPDEDVVVVLTGAGYKDGRALAALAGDLEPGEASIETLGDILGSLPGGVR